MPVAQIRGIQMNYDVLGDTGPWVALSPGGRVGMAGVQEMAESLAGKGYRVLIFDRRNCGASDVGISGGASEFDEWADDLFELTKQLGAQPCVAGGGSSGCRTSVTFAIRHPEAVSGLLLWKISGGAYATLNLGVRYYTEYIKAAGLGGMEAVCETEFFSERVREKPAEPRYPDGDGSRRFHRSHGAVDGLLHIGREPADDRSERGGPEKYKGPRAVVLRE